MDEKVDVGVIKNLEVEVGMSENQEHENVGQHLDKGVWQDYISVAHVGDNEQTVMDTIQQINLSNDAEPNAHPETPELENREQVTTILAVQSNASNDIVCTNPFEALREENEVEILDKDQTVAQVDSLNTSAQEVPSQCLDSLDENKGESHQHVSSIENDKEKNGKRSALNWADLVDEEEHALPLLLNSKLSPQAPEFVPKSVCAKKIDSASLVSDCSPTNACAIDFFDGDEEDMLDRCFDEVAMEGDISPSYQRSGTNKNKKQTHGRQHSWDGNVTEDFVPRHLPMRLAKRNHLTVSVGSNKSKRK